MGASIALGMAEYTMPARAQSNNGHSCMGKSSMSGPQITMAMNPSTTMFIKSRTSTISYRRTIWRVWSLCKVFDLAINGVPNLGHSLRVFKDARRINFNPIVLADHVTEVL